jgi:hypothetical protein
MQMQMKQPPDGAVKRIVDFYIRTRVYWVAAVIVLFAAFAMQRFLWATETFGIGIRTDSVAYLWSSENLAKGIGLGRLDGAGNFRPYTHWPPLYPIVLTIPRLLGFNGMESARSIGALCIALMIIVTGLAVSRVTNRSPWYVAGALLILVNSPGLWVTSLYAMSEPLFMVLSLSALLLFDKYLSKAKYRWLLSASLLMGLTLATRYVGVSLIAACFMILLIQKELTWKQKAKDGLLMVMVSLIPSAAWVIRNVFVAGTTTNRTLALVPIALAEIQKSFETIFEWAKPLLNGSPQRILEAGMICISAFILSSLYYRYIPPTTDGAKNRLWLLLVVYTLSYVLFTLLAKLFFDQTIPLFESRILLPFYFGLLLVLLHALYRLQEWARTSGWLLPALLTCVYVAGVWSLAMGYYGVVAGSRDSLIAAMHEKGLGLERMVGDPILPVLAPYTLKENRFFTDNIEILYFLSSLNSYQLLSSEPDQIARVTSEMDDHGVVLVFFDKGTLGPVFKANIPQLELIYQGDADVYVYPVR